MVFLKRIRFLIQVLNSHFINKLENREIIDFNKDYNEWEPIASSDDELSK